MTPGSSKPPGARLTAASVAIILLLCLFRLPSLVQPAGGDQGLYGYSGQRILAGDVMYRDMWDQKPPAIAFIYAMLWRLWPSEAAAAAADLAAAAGVACLLVVLGRRRFSQNVGVGAACLFLLFGDPYMQRLSGIYVRGQCEPFMALAIAVSLAFLAIHERRRSHLVWAGVALAAAFWLKYNAAAYGVTVLIASWAWGRDNRGWRDATVDLLWIGLGFGAVATAVLMYFAANGALHDLWLATIEYNLRYSNETYQGWSAVLKYVATFPIERARVDPLWFLGGLGALLIARPYRTPGSGVVIAGWLVAAVLSIAINGSRGLPNYFVQANPALALAASAGLASLPSRGQLLRYVVAGLLVLGCWRVGSDTPVWGWRLASLPGLIGNIRYDLQHVRGYLDRETYLRRFRGQKHDALEIERLISYVKATTNPAERIFVFGFSGGSVGWRSERASSSRFFWSRPVIVGLASHDPKYGWTGLLADLHRQPPRVVVLQKEEWNSEDHFMRNEELSGWLKAGYVIDHETPAFSVWRPRP